MPNAERYARYRENQTTIWVSKPAAEYLAREREAPGESAAAVLDRLLTELRRLRRNARAGQATKRATAKSTSKSTSPRSTTKSARKSTRKSG